MIKNKQKTVAITGASGFLGSELLRYFQEKDYNVIGLVRSPKKSSVKNVTYKKYDIEKQLDSNILKNVDLLIHTAYVKYSPKQPDAMDINVAGAEILLNASRKAKVQTNVFISTMSAHSTAESVYGKQKLAIEKLFSTKHDVVIRSGLIIGNGGIVREMANFMQTKHAVPLIGGGKQPLQVIGVYDLAKTIEQVSNKKISGLLTIATPTIYTYKEFYQALGKRLNVKFIFIPIPLSFLYHVVNFSSKLKISLSISTDNILGLKQLTAMDTETDLRKLKLHIDDLQTALEKTEITKS